MGTDSSQFVQINGTFKLLEGTLVQKILHIIKGIFQPFELGGETRLIRSDV